MFSFGPFHLLSLLFAGFAFSNAAHFLEIYDICYASFFNKFDVLNARLDLFPTVTIDTQNLVSSRGAETFRALRNSDLLCFFGTNRQKRQKYCTVKNTGR